MFENFDNETLTENFLNKYGELGYVLQQTIMLGYDEKGKIRGICIFMREVE